MEPITEARCMAPLDLEEEIEARDPEVALAFLVEQGMVEVTDDTITVPARFWSGGRFLPPDIRHTAPRVSWVGQRQSIRQPTTRLLASPAPVVRLGPLGIAGPRVEHCAADQRQEQSTYSDE
jgi:hypothetical protein